LQGSDSLFQGVPDSFRDARRSDRVSANHHRVSLSLAYGIAGGFQELLRPLNLAICSFIRRVFTGRVVFIHGENKSPAEVNEFTVDFGYVAHFMLPSMASPRQAETSGIQTALAVHGPDVASRLCDYRPRLSAGF
jgi:hypothetical protein